MTEELKLFFPGVISPVLRRLSQSKTSLDRLVTLNLLGKSRDQEVGCELLSYFCFALDLRMCRFYPVNFYAFSLIPLDRGLLAVVDLKFPNVCTSPEIAPVCSTWRAVTITLFI